MIREVLAQVLEVSVAQVASSGCKVRSKQVFAVLNTRLIFCIYWRCRALKSDKHYAKYWQTTHLL
jgi:hypothetical protein